MHLWIARDMWRHYTCTLDDWFDDWFIDGWMDGWICLYLSVCLSEFALISVLLVLLKLYDHQLTVDEFCYNLLLNFHRRSSLVFVLNICVFVLGFILNHWILTLVLNDSWRQARHNASKLSCNLFDIISVRLMCLCVQRNTFQLVLTSDSRRHAIILQYGGISNIGMVNVWLI